MFAKVQEITAVLLGLRKFIVMIILIAIGIIFRIEGLISGDNLIDLLKGTSIAFFASNSIEHIKSAITSYVNGKSQPIETIDSTVGDSTGTKEEG